MVTIDAATLGRRVLRARRDAGLSQQELAVRAGISRQAVGALEAGQHLPRVDAAAALAQALNVGLSDLVAPTDGSRLHAAHVLFGELRDLQPVRAARVGERQVCVPASSFADGESWSSPDGVLRDGLVEVLAGADLDAFVVVGCDPAMGILAELAPSAGPGRVLPVTASSGLAVRALSSGRAHAAVVHGRAEVVGGASDGHSAASGLPGGHRLPLARWRTGLAVDHDRRGALDDALGGRGPVVQRDAGAAAQAAYERALAAAGHAVPDGPIAAGHLDAARLAVATGRAAVTIEPIATALGLVFHPLETHVVSLHVGADHVDHPGAAAVGEVLNSARFRRRASAFGGYDVAGAA